MHGLHLLIKDLDQKICVRFDRVDNSLERRILTRLDRVESSLQLIGEQYGVSTEEVERDERRRPSVPRESVSRELHSKSHEESPTAEQGGTMIAKVVVPVCDSPNAPSPSHGGRRSAPPPSSLSLRRAWQELNTEETDPAMEAFVSVRASTNHFNETVASPAEKPWWIIMPNTPFRLSWDILLGLLVAHDMAVVPVSLAFKTGRNIFTGALFWPFLIIWTIDVPLNFFTGINRYGHVEVRLSRIARNYLLSWFLIDSLVLGSTWLEVLFDVDTDEFLLGRMGKGAKVIKVLRTLRLLRFARLKSIAEERSDHILSEYVGIVTRVATLLLLIVWLNHFIACGWWSLGVSMSEAGLHNTWTSHHHMESEPLAWQYFTALHWSLCQFTPAGMEVSPKNVPERIFSVCVLLFAMVIFSSFVSSITAAMTQLRQLHSTTHTNHTMLRRYLHSHMLPLDLTVRILNCVDYRLGRHQKEIHESDVHYLKYLSQPLRVELALEISAPILISHPFLKQYSEVGLEAMKKICLEAVTRCMLSVKDTLFGEDEPCQKMFFVVAGQLSYFFRKPCGEQNSESVLASMDSFTDEVLILQEGESCCEVSMWCPWVHCGTMKAERMSEVLALDVAAFTSITCSYKTVNKLTARYAKIFLDSMRKSSSEGEFISDIGVLDLATLDEMVKQAASLHGVHVSAGGEGPPSDGGAESTRPRGVPSDRDKWSL